MIAADEYRVNVRQHFDCERFRPAEKRWHTKAASAIFRSEAFIENALTIGEQNGDRVIRGSLARLQK
jgi:hypothetical protein